MIKNELCKNYIGDILGPSYSLPFNGNLSPYQTYSELSWRHHWIRYLPQRGRNTWTISMVLMVLLVVKYGTLQRRKEAKELTGLLMRSAQLAHLIAWTLRSAWRKWMRPCGWLQVVSQATLSKHYKLKSRNKMATDLICSSFFIRMNIYDFIKKSSINSA